jgi:hypothetical protein
MSMILLEPANTILYNSLEDQAADHLINGDFGKFTRTGDALARTWSKPDFTGVDRDVQMRMPVCLLVVSGYQSTVTKD